MVQEKESPPGLTVFCQFAFQPFPLLCANTGLFVARIGLGIVRIFIVGIQVQKQAVLVDKTEIAAPIGLFPDLRLHLVIRIMIARDIKKRHL